MMAGSSTDKRPPSDSPGPSRPARRQRTAAHRRGTSRKRPTPAGGDPSEEEAQQVAHPQAKYVRTEPAEIESHSIKEEKTSDEEHSTDDEESCQQEAMTYSSAERSQHQDYPITLDLPPGWRMLRDDNTQLLYYQDVETQYSTWVPPAPYTPTDWTRVERHQQSAYWVSEKLSMQFDEYGQTEWQRIIFDKNKGEYWYNAELNLRFFESDHKK